MQLTNTVHKLSHANLPPIPEKRFFTIGEVSYLCSVKPHVLRYWEQEFNQLQPNKRRGNRRYYQIKDVYMARQIRYLLYEQGYTISGARQQLKTEKGRLSIADEKTILFTQAPQTNSFNSTGISARDIADCITQLESVLSLLGFTKNASDHA